MSYKTLHPANPTLVLKANSSVPQTAVSPSTYHMDDRMMNGCLSSLRDSLTCGESSLRISCIPLVYPQMHAYHFWPENANKTLHSRGLYALCTLLVAVRWSLVTASQLGAGTEVGCVPFYLSEEVK